MRIFENQEDIALLPEWEDQVPLAKAPNHSSWTELPTPAQKEALPFEDFPIVEDFEIALFRWPEQDSWWPSWRKYWGYYLTFFSQQRGFICTFGLHGCAAMDYSQENFLIPLNFWDLDQGWEQVIFERDGYVYVLESDSDDYTSGYRPWFRVRKERYLDEWQATLNACCSIISQKEEI